MERREFVQKAHYHDVTECLFFSSSVFEEAVTAWCRNGLQLQEFPLDSFIYVRLEPPLQHFDVFCERLEEVNFYQLFFVSPIICS
ncbi:hypothetical protein T11_8977 [Trichinella zimbabwensis]|uniref:Uncharacterized protein n=1 Tax=Trichinella zimbabwensis TaxID=268475 RepID=A0A0V1HGK7_9BILA|nr:hypothetical protein T11_8977 [Trichinella zimbabwensis]